MSKLPRATVAERALKRAIEEETAQIQVDLQAAAQEIERLKGLLARISEMAKQEPEAIAAAPAGAASPAAAKLPPELQRQLTTPADEPPPGAFVDLNDADDLGEGRWV